ncbi:class F sortase [Nocardioides baculatus]|uniref:Class F sortase n=1 Tax=Nocardioides baculatus TaxID=2801337 RepID=A0ABS1LAU0_9ACTN|nr:class F sortase [Nocardioides baculatus]MBL0748528.1 class F sortase [Nocardioides baculatus]
MEPARRAPDAREAEAPRLAVLPSGRSVAVEAVGTTRAGVLDVPDDIATAGWWRGGARLGDPFGSMLIAAHVDSVTQGLGPFAELLEVTAGARIQVRSRARRQAYEVRSRRLVPRAALTSSPWMFDASGQARLVLVTCAPPYDSRRGGYQNLAVVTAVPVGRP